MSLYFEDNRSTFFVIVRSENVKERVINQGTLER